MPKPLVKPYLPSGKVTCAVVAGDVSQTVKKALDDLKIHIIMTDPLKTLPRPLAYHADMQMVNVCEGVFVLCPGISPGIRDYLKSSGCEIITGGIEPGSEYPYDIAYNCAIIGKRAFLNPRYADGILLDTIKKCGLKVVSVKQGYAKCSTCVVGEEAIITADTHIHRKACEEGIDSLLIPPQNNICLKGYDYGFIGGASGLVSERELAVFGDFALLNDADKIGAFLHKHGIIAISLGMENPVDLGGLIPLCSE